MNDINLIEEKKYIVTTESNKKMELYLRNYNNEELSISLNTIDNFFLINMNLNVI